MCIRDRNKALEVQADKGVYQPQIREATAELVEALLNLRYKADKSLLEKAVAEAAAIDVSGYSAEAVESYNAAKAKAEELLNNNDLSREDQEKIDEATAEPVSYTHLDVYKRQALRTSTRSISPAVLVDRFWSMAQRLTSPTARRFRQAPK